LHKINTVAHAHWIVRAEEQNGQHNKLRERRQAELKWRPKADGWANNEDDLRVSRTQFDGNFHSIRTDQAVAGPEVVPKKKSSPSGSSSKSYGPETKGWRSGAKGGGLSSSGQSVQLGKEQAAVQSTTGNAYQPPNGPPSTKGALPAKPKTVYGARQAPDQGIGWVVKSVRPVGPRGGARECRWLSLREFSAISLQDEELLARDSTNEPIYLVSMRAHLNMDDANFVPLHNFRPPTRSSAYRWWWRRWPGDEEDEGELAGAGRGNGSSAGEQQTGGGHARLPLTQLNCSVPNGPSSTASLASVQLVSNGAHRHAHEQARRAGGGGGASGSSSGSGSGSGGWRQARDQGQLLEQLTIQLDCGYLVLDLLASEAAGGVRQVELMSVSFYENWGGNMSTLASPFDWRRHLVFSTNNSGPLIRMPQFSRYTCEHRVRLADRSRPGLSLVLDRFELQRLAPQVSAAEPASEQELASGFERMPVGGEARGRPRNSRQARGAPLVRARRSSQHSGGTVILYKSPIVGGEYWF